MRKLLLLIIIVGLALAVIPFGMGFVAERDIKKWIDYSNQSTEARFNLSQYTRGWFTSSAQVGLQLRDNVQNQEVAEITFHEKIYHGPILWISGHPELGRAYISSNITLSPSTTASLNQWIADQAKSPEFIIHSKISLAGALETQVKIPKYIVDKPGHGTFTWQGFEATTRVSADYTTYKGNAAFAGMAIDSPLFNAVVNRLAVTYQGQMRNAENYQHDFSLNEPNIKVSMFGQTLFLLDQFNLIAKTAVVSNLLGHELKSDLNKISIQGLEYGPAKLALNISNINAEPIHTLREKFNKAQNGQMSPQEQGQYMAMTVVAMLPKLLEKGPVFELSQLDVQLPEGMVKANGKLEFPMNSDDAKSTLMHRLDNAKLTGHVQAPVVLVEKAMTQYVLTNLLQEQNVQAFLDKQKTDNTNEVSSNHHSHPQPMTIEQLREQAQMTSAKQLQTWEEKGYLQKTSDPQHYGFDFSLEKGTWTLNGHAVQ